MSRSFLEDHVLAGDADWDREPARPPMGARRRVPWPLLALLVPAGIAGALAWRARTTTAGDSASSCIATPGVLSLVAPDRRLPGPTLRGALLAGTGFDSAAWAGDLLVVNSWGSWCPPCRAETPELVRLTHATRDQDVEFLGVDVRDNLASAGPRPRVIVKTWCATNVGGCDE